MQRDKFTNKEVLQEKINTKQKELDQEKKKKKKKEKTFKQERLNQMK